MMAELEHCYICTLLVRDLGSSVSRSPQSSRQAARAIVHRQEVHATFLLHPILKVVQCIVRALASQNLRNM